MTEQYRSVTNWRNGEPIDRIYGGAAGSPKCKLIQKDGTVYQGEIKKKTIIVESPVDGHRFKSYVYVTADKRVFDRMGLPVYNIEVNELETEEVEEENNDVTQD